MMKAYRWLAIGIFLAASVAWFFGVEIYAVGWRFLHNDDVEIGSRKFHIPAGPYVWYEADSSRLTIFSAISDHSGHAAITLYGPGADSRLPQMVASGLCDKEKCDIEKSTVKIQRYELGTFTIRRWITLERPIIKVFYLSALGQVLVEFDGDEAAFRQQQPILNDLLTQAAQQQ